jgi:hypothetical protein
MAAGRDIREDAFVQDFLAKLPATDRDSFSDAQLLAVKAALGARKWGVHPVDLRWTFRLLRHHYYVVFLMGRSRRTLSRREQQIGRVLQSLVLALFLTFSALLGLVLLYLLKSALGIDIFDGFSLGLWDWLRAPR